MAMAMIIPALLLLLCPLSASAQSSTTPRLFLLGDSLLDTGNTNFLAPPVPSFQLFSNFTPYGQLFSPTAGPNGRFSDGKIFTDYLAEKMKIAVPSLFLDPSKSSATGYNFATFGAVVFRSPSFKRSLTNVNLDQQFQALNASVQGGLVPSAKDVVVVFCGSEDLVLWMETVAPTTVAFGSSNAAKAIAANYVSFIKKVYNLGFTNIIVGNALQTGCLPIVRYLAASKGCSSFANNPANNFNSALKNALNTLRKSTFKTGNVLLFDLYKAQGKAVSTAPKGNVDGPACCGAPAPLNALIQCGTGAATLCTNSTLYTYWDLIHPTQATLKRLFDLSWSSSTYVTPITIQKLFQNLGI